MKLGAEPKKVAILAGLLVIAAIALYVNVFSDDSGPAPTRPAAVPVPAAAPAPVAAAPRGGRSARPVQRTTSSRGVATAWNLRLGSRNPEERPDPATIDPTLHLELIAKLQGVELGPPGRNLFVFGAPPPPPAAKVDLPKNVPKIPVTGPGAPPPAGSAAPPGPPPAPQAPPMTFKYYGYKVSKTDGHKAAFLLDGEDILVAGETETIKGHYRIVRIDVGSITIEDTQFKSQQKLNLQDVPAA